MRRVRNKIVNGLRKGVGELQLRTFRPRIVEEILRENPELCNRIARSEKKEIIIAEIVTQLTQLPAGSPKEKYIEVIEEVLRSFNQ